MMRNSNIAKDRAFTALLRKVQRNPIIFNRLVSQENHYYDFVIKHIQEIGVTQYALNLITHNHVHRREFLEH